MNKTISILGTGGHGWEVFSDYIYHNKTNPVQVFGLTVDYGGSGGIWYRLQEINDFELSKKAFGDKKPVMPWGDFNKIILNFLLKKYGSIVASTLDFRSEDLDAHLSNFQIMADYFALDTNSEEHFENFFRFCFDYYQQNKDKLNYQTEKDFCFGYPWQDFVFWNLGGIEDVNNFYQSYNLFPKTFNIHFTSVEREVLIGQSEKGNKYFGEDQVDNAQEPILPDSLQILDTNNKPISVYPKFIEKLKSSDTIILPVGSITNWLPLLNLKEVQEILQEYSQNKKLYWFVNLQRAKNEFDIQVYIDYLKQKSINPILVIPANYQQLNSSVDRRYHNLSEIKNYPQELILPGIEIIENWKYDPKITKNLVEKYIA
jgi:hypothetical protein